MARLSICILIVFCINLSANSQHKSLIPYLEGNKYGLSDESNNIVISPKFDLVYPFFADHELSMAVKNGKTMIINRKGKKVKDASVDYIMNSENVGFEEFYKYKPEEIALDSDCETDSCPEFKIYNGTGTNNLFDKMGELYFVRAENKVFLIDFKGKLKSGQFDRIRHFITGEIEYAITENQTTGKSGLINNKGEQLLECVYDKIAYNSKGTFELTQSGKNYPFKTTYNEDYVPKEIPKKEMLPNRYISRRDSKFGLTDSLKNILLPFRYKKLYSMGDDFYLFWTTDTVGIINPVKGEICKIIVKAKVNGVIETSHFIPYLPYTKKLAFVNDAEYWHLISTEGNVLINDIEGLSIDFQNVASNIAALNKKGRLGIINNLAQVIIDFKYDKIFCLAGSQTYIAKEKESWYWLNSCGNLIYGPFENFKILMDDFLFVNKSGQWFYVDVKGKAFKK